MRRMKLKVFIAILLSICMTLSMMPSETLAIESEKKLNNVAETEQIEKPSYKLTDAWEILNEDASNYKANSEKSVDIEVQQGDFYYGNGTLRNTAKNVFLHEIKEEDFMISVKVDFKPNQDFQSAGLIIYKDGDSNFAATRRYHSSFGGKSLCIQGVDKNKFPEGHIAEPSAEQETISLQIVKKGTRVTSAYQLSDTEEWIEYDSREWNSFEGAKAEDLKVGLYTGNSRQNGSTATFSDFTIKYEGQEAEILDIFEESDEPVELMEYVSDWEWENASVGYGKPRKDCGVDGIDDPIILDGKTYAKGITAHAPSKVVYDIEGKGVQKFQAIAGINRSAGSCQFIVEADGQQLFKTEVLKGNQKTEKIDVDIPKEAKLLTLITNNGGDNNTSDHSVWADARFILDPAVSKDSLRKITLHADSYLPLNQQEQIRISGELVNGESADLSKAEITYFSSNEELLDVNQNGVMTAKKDGKATVTVRVILGNVVRIEKIDIIIGQGEGKTWNIESPDKSLKAMFMLTEDGEAQYFVLEENDIVVENSKLGLITNVADFTSGLQFEEQSAISEVTDSYKLYGAKVSDVKETGNEMTLTFSKNEVRMKLIVRMYNDGIAFRYEIEGEEGKELSVSHEKTTLKIPENGIAYAMNYVNDHEEVPVERRTFELTEEYCLPLLYKVDDTWCLSSEANLSPSYCGTYFVGDGTGNLNFHLSKEQSGDIRTSLPFASPWRFVVIGTAEEINLNTMAETLSPDCEGDFSWVKPGVTVWTWLNRESTSDLETYKKYVDFAASMGWQYLLLDEGWQPRGSSQGHPEYAYYGYFDWTEELIQYAEDKEIGLLVWANHKDLKDSKEREKRFQQWEEWGIAGVKPDFFYSSSQEYMQLYDELIQDTAKYHLLLNLHGVPKPTGERRTYPHLLTREGVFGQEQESPSSDKLNAFHNCMLPFVRNAVGPADYTPMFSYRNSSGKERFSLAQMAAMPVVYESGIQCLADRPEEYIGSPAEFYFKNMPASWDESVVLQAEPGELVTIARRNEENWYVGSMCNASKEAVIDLKFLDEGEYYAVICKDGKTKGEIVREMKVVTQKEVLKVPMLEAGGVAIKILKEKPSQPEKIVLDKTKLTLEQYETEELHVTITPEDTEMNQVSWSSSDENIVIVENGQLTAINPGHATITASTGFAGEIKVKCEVEVLLPEYSLAKEWEIVNMNPQFWNFNEDGSVTIQTQIGQIYTNQFSVKNLFLTPVKAKEFTVNVKLDFIPKQSHQTAGLILFQDENNNFCVSRRFHKSFGGDILAYHGLNNGKWEENSTSSAVKVTGEEEGPVSLQIEKKGNILTAYYRWENQSKWTKICEWNSQGLDKEIKVGLYVGNSAKEEAYVPATFSDFTIQYENEEAVKVPFSIKNEESVKVDKEALSALIKYAENEKKNENYQNLVPVVKELFEKALADAIAVNANEKATQKEVDAAYDTLLEKVHLLDFTGNTENLQVLVDLADAKVESMYTAESWKPFAKALEAAKKVLADENALQKEIDAARDALQTAMDGLVKKETVNKDKLATLVKDAEKYEARLDEYIPSTTEGFVASLKGARDVLADDAATQEEVDAAYSTLLQAIFGLREKPSKDKLEELLDKVEKMDLTQYSAKTAEAVRAAYDSALSVMKDENAEQKEVDAAVKALEKAIAVAKAEADANDKDEVTSGDGEKTETGGKDDAKKSAKTGDAANEAVPMMAGLAAILAVWVGKKRK